jgi:Bacterial Ig domain
VYQPFNVEITETSPGSQPHFEIMIGGQPQQIGLAAGIGGVSPFSCMPYIPNSVVFVFDVWGNDPEEICATAAQELAHSFSLDHCVEPTDPMTYFSYKGRRHYMDAQIQCGSDCDKNHRSPLGAECTGSDYQEHPCACGNGAETQNDVQVISTLFGNFASTPPTVEIVTPAVGDTVASDFSVSAEITDDVAVASAELRVDGTLVGTTTTSPYTFSVPAALPDGTHTLEVTGYDNLGTPGRARIQVIVGPGCKKPADCTDDTETCVGGRCVAGPDVAGGLGQTCIMATDCKSWLCANDDGSKYCVEVCKPGQCPASFGCRDDGTGGGYCWPGFDDGTGGCATTTGGTPLGAIALGLGFAANTWRRRRR